MRRGIEQNTPLLFSCYLLSISLFSKSVAPHFSLIRLSETLYQPAAFLGKPELHILAMVKLHSEITMFPMT